MNVLKEPPPKFDCHCLADVVLYIPNLRGVVYFGSVPRHDEVADSKHPQRKMPKDEKAEDGSSEPFQGKSQCWWPWFQGDKRKNRTSEGPWWLWAPKAAEIWMVLERGQSFGVISEKESDGEG